MTLLPSCPHCGHDLPVQTRSPRVDSFVCASCGARLRNRPRESRPLSAPRESAPRSALPHRIPVESSPAPAIEVPGTGRRSQRSIDGQVPAHSTNHRRQRRLLLGSAALLLLAPTGVALGLRAARRRLETPPKETRDDTRSPAMRNEPASAAVGVPPPVERGPAAGAPVEISDPRALARRACARGKSSLSSGDSAGAIRAYEEAISHDRAHPPGYRGLGLAYAAGGNRAAALRYLRRYLRLAPRASDRRAIEKRIRSLSRR